MHLTETAREGDEIMEGSFGCRGCRRTFPLLRGVPRLVPDALRDEVRATADRFGFQWHRFDALRDIYEQQFLDWIAPVDRSFFIGRIVLEGGCGKGRHTALAARFGAKAVLAIDLSSAVDVCFRNCRELPNVHVVQADILHLPLRRRFDYGFSVGVLHHLPDPRQGFLSLASKVKPKGAISVWVYGAEGNGWITHFVDPVRTTITSRMPKWLLYASSWLLTVPLWAVSKGLYRPVSRIPALSPLRKRLFYFAYISYIGRLSFRDLHNIVFDHLVAPVAFYLRRDQVEEWYAAIHAKAVRLFWHNRNSWRAFGRV